jgi:hypothetical protein
VPAKGRLLRSQPPDPQALAVLLAWRNRESLLLACGIHDEKPAGGAPLCPYF